MGKAVATARARKAREIPISQERSPPRLDSGVRLESNLVTVTL
jgi:hypothetical protein